MQVINLTINATPEIAELLKPVLAIATAIQKKQEPEYITIPEAVERCPYGYNTVRRWIVEEGLIPSRQPNGKNGRHVFKRTDFEGLLKDKFSGRLKDRKKKVKRSKGRPRNKPAAFV